MADDPTVNEDQVEEEVIEPTQDDAQEEVQEDNEDLQQEQEEQEEDAEEERPPSRREQLRINKLLEKYGDPRDYQAPIQKDNGIDYRKVVDADDDTYEQLSKASQEYGDLRERQAYQAANSRAEYLNWNTSLRIDTPQVHKDFPEAFKDPRVADALNRRYLRDVGYDEKTQTVQRPDIGYYEWMDSEMELAREMASDLTEKTRRNVTRQASRTGLRPDGSSAKRLDLSKAPQDMSDEELDAFISKQGLAPKKR